VTAEQAVAAAKAHFDPATASLVVVGDASVFGAGLKKEIPRAAAIAIGS